MKDKYDVVIIGAGIGGLVCGCYLAKAGLKVLIVEKNDKPGGYCTSFEKDGYRFDVGVHYLGGIKRGVLGQILEELDIKDQIKFHQFDPTDKIIMPNDIVYIKANWHNTVKEFKKKFSKDKKDIEKFFNFILEKDIWKVYKKVKKINFAELLKDFFNNDKLKGTISVLLRNIGLSANRASALTAVILFREYTLDPGYYPIGGMQKFSDILKDIFINYGGEVLFSRKVIKILTSNRKVKGIVLEDNKKVFANIVVSNTDATMTFEELLDIKTLEVSIVKRLEISPSPFVVYLGLRKNLLKDISNDISNIWPFFSYDIRKIPLMSRKDIINGKVYITMISFQSLHDPILIKNNSTTIGIFATVNYESSNFWKEYKEKLSLLMILKAQELIPFSDQDIDKKVVATPYTFYEYTLNKNGSAFGWASIPSQISASILPQSTSVEGLFLVGHWTTIGSGQGGVPKVSFSGRRVASIILKKMGKEWKYGAYQ